MTEKSNTPTHHDIQTKQAGYTVCNDPAKERLVDEIIKKLEQEEKTKGQ